MPELPDSWVVPSQLSSAKTTVAPAGTVTVAEDEFVVVMLPAMPPLPGFVARFRYFVITMLL